MPSTIEFPNELLPQLVTALGDYACSGNTELLEQCAFSDETEENGEYIRLLVAQMLSGQSNHALYVLGDCFECGHGAIKNPEAARRCYIEDMQRGYAPAEIDLGHMDLNEDRFSDALSHFHNAMKSKDLLDEVSLRRCYRWMGETYYYREEPDFRKALECYTISAEQYQDADSFYSLGMLYQEENSGFFSAQKALSNFQAAEKKHHRGAALFLAEYCIDGYPKLGIQQDLDQAERYLLPHLDDTDREVLVDLGGIYLHRAEKDQSPANALKAIGKLTKAWKISEDSNVALDLGTAFVWAGDTDAAVPYLEYADSHGEYRMSAVLGGHYWKHGKKEKAMDCFEHAFEGEYLWNKGYTAIYLGLLEEAGSYSQMEKVLSFAIAYLRDSIYQFTECRLILQNKLQSSQMGKSEAAEILEELIGESSSNQRVECHRLLGDYYHEIHDNYKAFDHWKEAFKLGNAECAVSLGRLAETGYEAVPASTSEAYSWFCKAADAGSELGKKEKACFRMVAIPNGLFGSTQKMKRVCNANDISAALSKPIEPPVSRAPAFCRYCGTKLVPGGRFCGKCGKRIE